MSGDIEARFLEAFRERCPRTARVLDRAHEVIADGDKGIRRHMAENTLILFSPAMKPVQDMSAEDEACILRLLS